MILQIQHETRLEYVAPVVEAVCEMRMEPLCDDGQTCHSFFLTTEPAANVYGYTDGFQNEVHYFSLRPPHRNVRLLAASVVVTHRPVLAFSEETPPVEIRSVDVDLLDFLSFRGPIQRTPAFEAVREQLAREAEPTLPNLLQRISNYIQGNFEYRQAVTHSSSPVDHLLEVKVGVCQDFTHLAIGLLRSFGFPARYISGYLHRPGRPSESHAWCEVWMHGVGWVGYDATNHCFVDDHFVKAAVGRDFTDVSPNRGVYRGPAEEVIFVRVETLQLDRLPPLSWRENLPPLETPLSELVPGPRRFERAAEELSRLHQEQQQDQQ